MLRKSVVAMVAACLFIGSGFAQTSTGTITGTITDSSGALVPSARITITNTGTSAKAEVTTGDSGNYTVPQLKPGAYSVSVAAAGFKGFEQSGIQLRVQQQARVDIVLQVGGVTESVAWRHV
ncbi:MAG: carboxypeptidase regulatory-like domain-containing protein [Acidobacteriia bacterium]|nr:carboxypeptidase regulatory-like domain-containing protein [Terriglobia bacterium]